MGRLSRAHHPRRLITLVQGLRVLISRRSTLETGVVPATISSFRTFHKFYVILTLTFRPAPFLEKRWTLPSFDPYFRLIWTKIFHIWEMTPFERTLDRRVDCGLCSIDPTEGRLFDEAYLRILILLSSVSKVFPIFAPGNNHTFDLGLVDYGGLFVGELRKGLTWTEAVFESRRVCTIDALMVLKHSR